MCGNCDTFTRSAGSSFEGFRAVVGTGMSKLHQILKTFLLLSLLTGASMFSTAAQAGTPGQSAALPPLSPSNWPTAQFNSSTDPSVQKARQLLDGTIRALGGDMYVNLRNLRSEGRSYAFWQNQPSGQGILFWRFWEWPDKDRYELTKQRDVVELNIGDKGYEITFRGTAAQDSKQLEEYNRRREHSIEWVIRKWLPAQGTLILYSGTAIVERNLVDQVSVINSSNDAVTISIDPNTHLPVEKSYEWRDPIDRQKNVEAEIFSNYRLVDGINTPFSTVRTLNGEMRNQRFLSAVSYNVMLPTDLFVTKGITYNPEQAVAPKKK